METVSWDAWKVHSVVSIGRLVDCAQHHFARIVMVGAGTGDNTATVILPSATMHEEAS